MSKADAAVKNMKLLIPTIEAKAFTFKIPMPGHSCSEKVLEDEFQNLQKLENLVEEYDIVFNVLDSREARYFPTLFSGIYNKLCISVGLGYDNFVIVKHGYRNFKELLVANTPKDTCFEDDFGCFFCNDYLSPKNTMANRTLDQQCTGKFKIFIF